jgi:phosphate starvation-inducible PhoH-like protein
MTHKQPAHETLTLTPADAKRLQNLAGNMNEHLREVEAACHVKLAMRGNEIRVTGERANVETAQAALTRLYRDAKKPLTIDLVQLTLTEFTANKNADLKPATHLKTRQASLKARTPNQENYLEAMAAHDITFGIGPAGTGKTYLAVASAVDALERDAISRIVLVRPAVEAGERLGFLPGDLAQKVDPYLRPLYDALYDLLGFDKTLKLIERQIIEIAPLAYMRGRTLNGAFIILDEAQNTTPEQMKMFLTRVGFGARVVVTGDTTQIDLQRGQRSGLIDAQKILKNIPGIAFVHFTSRDVVRHPVVQRIVEAYAKAEQAGKE